MKQTKIIMGMPITIEILGANTNETFKKVFDYFKAVDKRYSTYKKESEISKINKGLPKSKWSAEMKDVLDLCGQTKRQTRGYFNIKHGDKLDPSGLVKGWAINNAARMLSDSGYKDFYVDAGGDIQVSGTNSDQEAWQIGIRNPFNNKEIVKVVAVTNEGVATSGTYIRGQHIYDPFKSNKEITFVKSLTVIGPNIYEADRFATAAFAMGKKGLSFINSIAGLEGYMIDENQKATFTPGFERYVVHA
jgi:thiamine biosynthesis lipoprotein